MFVYKEQHLTDLLPKPQEGVVYEFDYGSPLVHYKTGDKFSEEQDAMIMKIPKEDMIAAYEKAGLQSRNQKVLYLVNAGFNAEFAENLHMVVFVV